MKKDNILLIFSCLCIVVCIPGIYFLEYKNIAIILLGVLILCDLFLYLSGNIRVRFRLMKKKSIIYADIANSKIIKILFEKDKKIINKVNEIIRKNIKDGCVKKVYTNQFIILTKLTHKNDLINLTNKINEEVSSLIKDEMFILSLRFGIQVCNSNDFSDELNKAMLACSKAKRKPLITYCFYDEDDTSVMVEEKRILDILISALKKRELNIYFQPKYDYKAKKIVGSEALVRLIHDDEVIPAYKFIGIAEKYGFTVLLDKYVLKEVCKKIREMKKEKLDFNVVSINVSRNTLCEKDIIEYYSNVLEQYGVKKSEIEFEVTERSSNDESSLESVIHELAKSFNVSVDDFGIGNSSLSMLTDHNIKTIKIDKEFIKDSSTSGRKILSNIIKLARELGFNLVAEGVETEEEFKYLKSKGCNVIQGYYYSKPLPFEEFENILKGEDE